jgi:hypothetical protein
MRTPQELQPTVTLETVKVQENRLILQAQVCLEMPLPEQDADLPKRLEAGIERAGQTLKRRLFQHAIERADAELLLAQRHGKQGQGIICRGTTSFTFQDGLRYGQGPQASDRTPRRWHDRGPLGPCLADATPGRPDSDAAPGRL